MVLSGQGEEGRWYTIQTLSNMEGRVKASIEKFVTIEEMEGYVYEVLVPTEVVTEIKGGKKTSKTRKFYPGYAFVRMKLYDEQGKILQEPWHFIRNIQGVINFVGGNHPRPLKEDEIGRILDQVAASRGKEIPKVNYNVNDEVRITEGPFVNLTGRIDEIDLQRGRLKVSVSIFGRFTPVELEFWQVQRAENV